MSRHRRQRNKRFRRALATVHQMAINYGVGMFLNHGRMSKHLSPLERIAVRRELVILANNQECVW